jgi:hypothetical protein
VANGNSLEEGSRLTPFASHSLDEKASKRMPFFTEQMRQLFTLPKDQECRISAVYPVDNAIKVMYQYKTLMSVLILIGGSARRQFRPSYGKWDRSCMGGVRPVNEGSGYLSG